MEIFYIIGSLAEKRIRHGCLYFIVFVNQIYLEICHALLSVTASSCFWTSSGNRSPAASGLSLWAPVPPVPKATRKLVGGSVWPESCSDHCFPDIMPKMRACVHHLLCKLKAIFCQPVFRKEPEQKALSHFVKGRLSTPRHLVLDALM